MFADMKSTMMETWHEHYALLAVNCMSLESAYAAIRMAGKNCAPIILNLYQGHLAHFPTPVTAAVVKTLTGSAPVPVALALNHDKNPDCIRQTFRAGFSGLIIGASAFPLEENVRQTRAAVELAANAQLYAEGELGHLAGVPRYNQAAGVDLMTQPTDVESFIVQIDIDLLAILIGTAHSMYAPGAVPTIDSQRLAEISHCPNVPLVLHGSSGTPFDQLQLRMTLEVTKINVGAVIFERGKSALLHALCHDVSIELMDTLKAMKPVFEEATTPHLQTNGSIGKTRFIFCYGLYASTITHRQGGLHAGAGDLTC